jgi:serine phosphatase RsbU (regulator of sigma subunit)
MKFVAAPGTSTKISSTEVSKLRELSERRIFTIMGVSMSVCAAAWGIWCYTMGFRLAACIPASYVVVATLSLLGLHLEVAPRASRRTLLIAGLVLPFLFQMMIGGLHASGMVMLWCLPTLVAAVNLQSGMLRYAYLIVTGSLISLFAAFDPTIDVGITSLGIPANGLLAFNLSTSMLANFVLADRMLHAQTILRRTIFSIQSEVEHRFLRTLEERNQDMQHSLDYAARIQMALMPDRSRVRGLFDEVHVHYRPKEAVGGDLIWHARVDDRSYYMVIDCTGHGVPGSLMGMLIHGLLNEVVHTWRNLSAAQVVRRTQQLLDDRLDRRRTGNTDGAEMAVLCFDHTQREVTCCALGCGVIMQEGGEMVHLKSHSSNASLLSESRLSALQEHRFTITADTRLFLYTDGIADQFCAKDQRKFTRARLEATLKEAAHLSPDAQMSHLLQTINTWRGDTPLVDDMLFVGAVPAACWRTISHADQASNAA